jgi:hypothetical protein
MLTYMLSIIAHKVYMSIKISGCILPIYILNTYCMYVHQNIA